MDELTADIKTPCASSPSSIHKFPDDARSCCSNLDEERGACWAGMLDICQGIREDVQLLKQLFNEKFFTTTMLMSYISFVSNFAYYGMIYGLPATLKKEQSVPSEGKSGSWSPAA